jgi:hypothetical protein
MTFMSVLRLTASVAWTGAALSAATPASALVATLQSGPYAACSAETDSVSYDFCGTPYSFRQTIKFVGNPCSGGGCSDQMGTSYTESQYQPGRKVTTIQSTCGQSSVGTSAQLPTYWVEDPAQQSSWWNIYGLDSCAC